MRIAIINGPNLNLLGVREPGIYGQDSFEKFLEQLRQEYLQVEFTYFQSNIEGELVSAIQKFGFDYDGILLNPGGYTHTSVAIGDAVAAIRTPVVEIHISNTQAREEFRKISHIAARAVGSIIGLGLTGYRLGVEYFLSRAAKATS